MVSFFKGFLVSWKCPLSLDGSMDRDEAKLDQHPMFVERSLSWGKEREDHEKEVLLEREQFRWDEMECSKD